MVKDERPAPLELRKMHRGNRFRLMFGLPLINEDNGEIVDRLVAAAQVAEKRKSDLVMQELLEGFSQALESKE